MADARAQCRGGRHCALAGGSTVWTRFVADDRAAERKRRKLDNAIRLKDGQDTRST
jgi:hypothetical protein